MDIARWIPAQGRYDGELGAPSAHKRGGQQETSHPLERHRDALADADAHRRERVAAAVECQFQSRRAGDARAGHAERVAERDGAAIDVDARVVVGNPEIPQRR